MKSEISKYFITNSRTRRGTRDGEILSRACGGHQQGLRRLALKENLLAGCENVQKMQKVVLKNQSC